MTVPRPHDHPISTHAMADEALAGTGAVCDRIRAIRWQDAINTLVESDPHKPSQP